MSSKADAKLIKITSEIINIKLTMTIKLEVTSCSLNTLHTNMKRRIKALL